MSNRMPAIHRRRLSPLISHESQNESHERGRRRAANKMPPFIKPLTAPTVWDKRCSSFVVRKMLTSALSVEIGG